LIYYDISRRDLNVNKLQGEYMLHSAFLLAKQVHENKLTQAEASRQLNEEHGANINSAKIMITVYDRLVRGVVFKRALSSPDMHYYLAQFFAEGGSEALDAPVSALWQHIKYYEDKNNVNLKSLRDVATQFTSLSYIDNTLENINTNFQDLVERSQRDPAKERHQRLEYANEMPTSRITSVKVYARNPDVVAEVLIRANGLCEKCVKPAPFIRRKDKTPYLEVHHKIKLADGGKDIVSNAEALCPNCHRKEHYGI